LKKKGKKRERGTRELFLKHNKKNKKGDPTRIRLGRCRVRGMNEY